MTHLPIPPDRPLVLFTDLDGTLIDHHTYSADSAREALYRLAGRGVPVVFCSTKTFAEQWQLQQELGISHPFILENGSAVALPKGYFSTLPPYDKGAVAYARASQPARSSGGVPMSGTEHHDIFIFAHADAAAIHVELSQFQHITGYSTASDAELSVATGLTGAALQHARERWFTETLITPLDAETAVTLKKKLAAKGWTLSKGGRFFTVQSAQVNKGKAVQWLKEVFRHNMPGMPLFAATGDSPNDAPMLAAVDFPFLVQRHDGTWLDADVPGIRKIEGIGPAGFSAAVQMLLGEGTIRP